MTSIDHITITCRVLEEGADLVEAMLGVRPQAGGKHPRMATHNLLLKVGEEMFLEVIAPDPDAAPPGRPRWFALDTLAADAPARLSNWVARTDVIDTTRQAMRPHADPGIVEPMSRGERTWRITIAQDGSLPLDGIAPSLIQWDQAPYPPAAMPDLGITLRELVLYHPDATRVRAMLDAIGMQGPVTVATASAGQRPHLVAHFDTPAGARSLPMAP